MISAILSVKISAPGFWNDKDRYFEHSFVKPPKPWIDPSKETIANKTALQSGQKTYKQIAAENGSDWKKQIDDICEVLAYAKDTHGVDLGGVILGQKKTDGLYQAEAPGDDGDGESSSPDNGEATPQTGEE